jgi:nicotinate-nucleotide adenylyltransferase
LRPVKIGFLGGSFDPVHFGHMLVAQDAYEHMRLDKLVFVPAAQAPLKSVDSRASAEDRLGMLSAVIEGDDRFGISDFEVRRGGVSYTVDSARHFRAQYPNDSLFWVIGADQLTKLHLWKDVRELAALVEFICLDRPGVPGAQPPTIPGLRVTRCEGHLMEVSSTELRARVRGGLPLDYFVPQKAIDYIRKRGLYRDAT